MCDGNVVCGIDANQLLNQDDAHDVVAVLPPVDGHSAVAGGQYLVEGALGQDGIGRKHEDLVDRGHCLLGHLPAKRKSALNDGDLGFGELPTHAFLCAMHVHKLLQLRAAEHGRMPLAQHEVQQLGDGPGHRRGDKHKEAAERRAGGTYRERVVLADGLRDNLAHNEQHRHTEDDGDNRVGQSVDDKRKCLRRECVAQQQRDEQIVLVCNNRNDFLCAALLALRASAAHYLQVDVAHAEKAQREAAADPGEGSEADARARVEAEG
mmetsp:Transcript_21145/g.53262  ORF Transcript_21145/g.53262 Transcript_21145/m.53262 type:complete len:265 (+) Transcript_21145:817-1611(+)